MRRLNLLFENSDAKRGKKVELEPIILTRSFEILNFTYVTKSIIQGLKLNHVFSKRKNLRNYLCRAYSKLIHVFYEHSITTSEEG